MTALAPARAPQRRHAPATPRPAAPATPATKKAHLRLIPRPASLSASTPRRTPFVLLLLTLLAAGLVGLLLLNTIIDQDAFRLAALQEAQTSLDVKEATLHQVADDDADPQVLASRAAALGMVPAGVPSFVREAKLPKGQRIGNLLITGTPTIPTPASPAPAALAAATAAAPAAAAASAPAVVTPTKPPTKPPTAAATAPVVPAAPVTTTKTTTTRSASGTTTTTIITTRSEPSAAPSSPAAQATPTATVTQGAVG